MRCIPSLRRMLFFIQQPAAQAQFKLFSGSLRLNGGDSAAALRALRNGAPRVVSEKEGGKKGGEGRFSGYGIFSSAALLFLSHPAARTIPPRT
jgi:hypothetical protein